MDSISNKNPPIPTNIISGFLGVGKTTTILSLLKTKPEEERWAVLVNEFGEIGIDGALFQGNISKSSDVFIHEVAGGCMCCAAGLSLPIVLNQILDKAKPQRLLIEPSGLGHPRGVLKVLCADEYRDVLDIQKNITLVDARNLADSQNINHDTFNQQIDIADIIIGNKSDLYQNTDRTLLEHYIAKRKNPHTKVLFTAHGNLNPAVLQGATEINTELFRSKTPLPSHGSNINESPIPEEGYLKKENKGEGFRTVGWRFSDDVVFKRKMLTRWFNELCVERTKAVMITDDGVISYNKVNDDLTEIKLDDSQESRIEIIARQIDIQWESKLLACLTTIKYPTLAVQ